MSGTVPNLSNIWQTFQNLVTGVNAIGRTLTGGLVVQPTPASIYTFAALPATAAAWTSAVCSNGRKPGEGSGSGTGVPVFFNPSTSTWFSYCSGAVVTA